MTAILLALLFAFDFVILAVVFLSRRRTNVNDLELMHDLTEERDNIRELREQVREELERAQRKSKDLLAEVKKIAAEAEQEVKGGSTNILRDVGELTKEAAKILDGPLQQLTEKQLAVESLLVKAEKYRVSLQKLIGRGEKICKFFDQKIPYEEILDDLEDKKYVDARHMLAKGIKPQEVARDLGMSLSEVKLVAGVSGYSIR